jgi:hypothetical protein
VETPDAGQRSVRGSEVDEHDLNDGTPVFVLTGTDGKEPEIIVADDLAIRGRLKGTVEPGDEENTLRYRSNKGDEKSVAVTTLLGSDKRGIYEVKSGEAVGHYIQFPKDQEGLLASAEGQVSRATGGPTASRCFLISTTDRTSRGRARR